MKAQKEVIQGEIISLDVDNRFLNLRRTDPITGGKEELEVFIPENVELKVIDSLMSLDCGDIVRVDVTRCDASRTLQANILEEVV